MKFLNDEEIICFINQHHYDVRKTGNARWIDQKCTPDVVCIIADCILQYQKENKDKLFSTKDIWYSKYAIENVKNIFKKANLKSASEGNEYDKFFQQPIKLLAYAGILKESKIKTKNYYTVINEDILQYIALRERNALNFLNIYITKVLTDSEILKNFNDFFLKQTKDSYDKLKDSFYVFTIKYTDIGNKTKRKNDPGKKED